MLMVLVELPRGAVADLAESWWVGGALLGLVYWQHPGARTVPGSVVLA